MLNLGKHAEIILLLFTSNLVKIPQQLCNKQLNGKNIYPIYVYILCILRVHNSLTENYESSNKKPALGRHVR